MNLLLFNELVCLDAQILHSNLFLRLGKQNIRRKKQLEKR
jgi:hypothetical protein